MCLALMLLFPVLDTAAKYVSHSVPALEVVWARYAVSLVFAVIVLRPWRESRRLRHAPAFVQVAPRPLPARVDRLQFRRPPLPAACRDGGDRLRRAFFIVGLAGPVLGEWVGPRRWAAAIIGFIGVLIVVQPGPAYVPAGGAAVARRRLLLRRL